MSKKVKIRSILEEGFPGLVKDSSEGFKINAQAINYMQFCRLYDACNHVATDDIHIKRSGTGVVILITVTD